MLQQLQIKKIQQWVAANHLYWAPWCVPEPIAYPANDQMVGELAVPLPHLPIIRSWMNSTRLEGVGNNFIEQANPEWVLQMTEQQMELTNEISMSAIQSAPTSSLAGVPKHHNVLATFFKEQGWQKKQVFVNKFGAFDSKALVDRLAMLQLAQQKIQANIPASVGVIECSNGKMGKLFGLLAPTAKEASVILFDPEFGLFKLGAWSQAAQHCQSYFKLCYAAYAKQASLSLYQAS